MPAPFRTLSLETIAGLLVAAVVIGFALGQLAPGDDRDDAPVSLDDPITRDPDVRTGTLANGVRYYIRENAWPEERAELRLAVDAGSVLEDDDQRGMAHALEHMAFRGTRRFPHTALDEYLQSVGMRLGDDVNATTSADETIYRLTVPTDRAATLDSGVTILAEWAHAVTLDAADARREAPVVFEEGRARHDAEGRVAQARDRVLLRGSRYADRPVIGDTTSLRRFDVGAIRRFYRDWYRPERMVVVAVGDFDGRAVERAIRSRFDRVPRGSPGRAAPSTTIPRRDSTETLVLTDPEVTSTRVALWYSRDLPRPRTLADYRRGLVERLARDILRERLESEATRADSPLITAGITRRFPARPMVADVIGATFTDGRAADGVAVLAAVVGRLGQHGPSEAELARVKNALLRERREPLGGPGSSDELADLLVNHALAGATFASAADAYRWTNALLPGIGAGEVAAFVATLAPASHPLVVVTVPGGRLAGIPPSAALLAALDSGFSSIPDSTEDVATDAVLLAEGPRAGTVRARRTIRAIDTEEWTLGNGMRVLLKPTRYADDGVVVRVSAPGGASLARPTAYASAYMSDKIVEAMGVGSLDGQALGRLLDRRGVDVTPRVTDEQLRLSAEGRPSDLPLLLQVIHLYLTAPRESHNAFEQYRDRLATVARDRAADPEAVFADSVVATLRPGDHRALVGSSWFMGSLAMDDALRFWRERSANGSNFTAVIVGDFETWRVAPLVEQYLASLPAGHRERPRAMDIPRIDRTVSRTIRQGIEPRAQTSITFGDTLAWTPEADADLNVVRDLLDLVLQARLREQLGGTYDVSVSASMRGGPPAAYEMTVAFTAAPERIDSLAAAAVEEVERLRTRGPTADEADKVRAAAMRHHADGRTGNDYWSSELAAHAVLGWSLESIATHGEEASSISRTSLAAATARYLDGRRFVRVTRLPADRSAAR